MLLRSRIINHLKLSGYYKYGRVNIKISEFFPKSVLMCAVLFSQ